MMNSRAGGSLQSSVVVAALVAAAAYLALRFGFEFILENGTLLAGAGFLFLTLRMRPWWPAVFLLIQVPVQGLLIQHLGLAGNLMSLVAVAAFLSTQPVERLPRVLLGTTTQRLAAVFILGVSISFFSSERDFSTLVSLLQKITLLFVLAAVLHALRRETRVVTLARFTVMSTGVIYALSLIEFYFGGDVFPGIGAGGTGLLEMSEESLSSFRTGMSGLGTSVGINRFAFIGILPLMLSIGLVLARGGERATVWATIAAITIGFGIFAAGSRSAALAVAVAIGVVFLFYHRGWFRLGLAIIAVAATFVILLQFVSWGGTSYARIFRADPSLDTYSNSSGTRVGTARLDMWGVGIDMFKEHPIFGVGLEGFRDGAIARRTFVGAGAVGPHGAAIQLMVETGLLGMVPFVALVVYVVWVLVRGGRGESETSRMWRVIFLAAFVAMMIDSTFHTYHFDRFFWIPIAFAALLEETRRRRDVTASSETIPTQIGPDATPAASPR